MGPKSYFENYLIGNRENKIFVCKPCLPKYEIRVKDIIKPVAEELNLKVEESDDMKVCVEIPERIFNGINTARILLFDLSVDERYGCKSNANVMYELGIARMVRDDKDIVITTDAMEMDKIPSDIKNTYVIKDFSNISKESFKEKLESILSHQTFFQDKRIDEVVSLFDTTCLEFILCFGLNPRDGVSDHFFDKNVTDTIQKLAVLRLLDLKIIYTAMDHTGMAYHFTEFGRAVIERTAAKLRVKRKEEMICKYLSECRELLECL